MHLLTQQMPCEICRYHFSEYTLHIMLRLENYGCILVSKGALSILFIVNYNHHFELYYAAGILPCVHHTFNSCLLLPIYHKTIRGFWLFVCTEYSRHPAWGVPLTGTFILYLLPISYRGATSIYWLGISKIMKDKRITMPFSSSR
jgi:hypothetical protein